MADLDTYELITEWGVQVDPRQGPLVMPESVARELIGKPGYDVFTRSVRPRAEGFWIATSQAVGKGDAS